MPDVYDDQDTHHDTDMAGFEDSFHNEEATGSGPNRQTRRAGESQGVYDPRDLRSQEGLKATGAHDLARQARDAERASKRTGAIPSKDLRAAEDEASLYKREKKDGAKRSLNAKAGWWTKKKVGIAGSFIGTGVGLSIFGFTLLSGPFELIHIAQLLSKSHFSALNDASDTETGKLYRWVKSGGDASQTRLGWLANRYKNTMLGQLKDAGMEPSVGKFASLQGWTIDPNTESQSSPFKGMNQDEVKGYLIDNGVPEGSFNVSTGEGGLISVTPESGGLNFLKTYSSQKGVLQFMTGQINESKIPNALRWRWVGKAYGITWHPFVAFKNWLNAGVNNAFVKVWNKALKDRLKTGTGDPDIVNAENAQQQETDPKTGKPIYTGVNGGIVDSPGGFSKGLQSIKHFGTSPGGKITGGVAAAVGVVCLLKTVSNNIGDIKYAQVAIPMMRLGMEAVIMGYQVEYGHDVPLGEMGSIVQQLYNPKTGQDWSDSKTAEADSGLPMTGTDLDSAAKSALSEAPPSWLSWTDNSAVGTLCSTGGQIITGVVSFALGVFTGEAASTVLGFVAGEIASPAIDENLTKLATNNLVDVADSVGPERFNEMDYGAALSANAEASQMGATQLSTTTAAELNNMSQQEQEQQFQHQSLAYRIFNPADDESLFSKMIDNTSPSASENTVHLADLVLGTGQSLASLPMNLFSSFAHADTVTTYNYPFGIWGFSPQDMTNPIVANPYENAGAVATLLDNNNVNGEGDYISKADQCFGVNIEKVTETDGTQDWDVIPNGVGVNLYNNTANTNDYYNPDCASPTADGFDSSDWLRLRFFIFDTGLMEGWTCEHGDDQSCVNDGVDTTTVTSPVGGKLNINDAAAQNVISKSGATVGYAIYDSGGTQLASYQANNENYGASITKAMLLVAYLKQAGANGLSSQAQSELTAMIENSDNDAANWVYNNLTGGAGAVSSVASEAGMSGFQIDLSDPTYVLGQSKITAGDFANFFSKIDTYMPASQKAFGLNLLSHLSSADQQGLLKAGIQGTVYSKEGWKPETNGLTGAPYVVNQAAQFTENGTTYGIAVTVGGTQDEASGEALIQQVTEALLGTSGK